MGGGGKIQGGGGCRGELSLDGTFEDHIIATWVSPLFMGSSEPDVIVPHESRVSNENIKLFNILAMCLLACEFVSKYAHHESVLTYPTNDSIYFTATPTISENAYHVLSHEWSQLEQASRYFVDNSIFNDLINVYHKNYKFFIGREKKNRIENYETFLQELAFKIYNEYNGGGRVSG
jgi:hypothetical protein